MSGLLLAFIALNTGQADLTYYAFRVGAGINPTLIAIYTAGLKLGIVLAMLLLARKGTKGLFDAPFINYTVPAGLYLFNSLLYLTALQLTSPGLLQMCMLAKIPTTGLLHHWMIKRQTNIRAWIALFALCIGLLIFNVPTTLLKTKVESQGSPLVAPLAGGIIATISALASIYNEKLIKTGDFYVSQCWLYGWGLVFALLVLPFSSSTAAVREVSVNEKVAIALSGGVVAITAFSGLLVALILRKGDALIKLVGSSACVTTICVSQYTLFPEVRESTLNAWTVSGGLVVVVSAWAYNRYKI